MLIIVMDALPFTASDYDAGSQAFLSNYAVGELLGLCVRGLRARVCALSLHPSL